jgi:hypothetical protein
MKTHVETTIGGISPLLMHAFPIQPIEAIEKKTREEQAELAAYRTPEGVLHVPGVALQRCFISGATYSKGKGRGSLQKSAAACILVNPEYVELNSQEYTIDSRPVVVPATKGRITRHRPRFDKWELSFVIEFDDSLISAPQLRKIVDDSGSLVGLLDFRPEKRGPFGRFVVNSWKHNGKA